MNVIERLEFELAYFETAIKHFNHYTTKAWATIDRLSIIWRSDLSDEIKRDFFEAVAVSVTTVSIHHLDANETHGEKTR